MHDLMPANVMFLLHATRKMRASPAKTRGGTELITPRTCSFNEALFIDAVSVDSVTDVLMFEGLGISPLLGKL